MYSTNSYSEVVMNTVPGVSEYALSRIGTYIQCIGDVQYIATIIVHTINNTLAR